MPICVFDYSILHAISMGTPRKWHPVNDNTSMGRHKSWYKYGQCCSCLFVSGRTVVYRGQYKRPQCPPKIDFGGPNYRLQRLMMHLMLTGPAGLCWRLERPGRTPSTSVAWQLQHWVWVPNSPLMMIQIWVPINRDTSMGSHNSWYKYVSPQMMIHQVVFYASMPNRFCKKCLLF